MSMKQTKVIKLEGSQGKSCCYICEGKYKYPIEAYQVMYFDMAEEDSLVLATHETESRFVVVLEDNKSRALVEYNTSMVCNKKEDVAGNVRKLDGIFALIWCGALSDTDIHFLWIDGRKGEYRNVLLESYGYSAEEIFDTFQKVFQVMQVKNSVPCAIEMNYKKDNSQMIMLNKNLDDYNSNALL